MQVKRSSPLAFEVWEGGWWFFDVLHSSLLRIPSKTTTAHFMMGSEPLLLLTTSSLVVPLCMLQCKQIKNDEMNDNEWKWFAAHLLPPTPQRRQSHVMHIFHEKGYITVLVVVVVTGDMSEIMLKEVPLLPLLYFMLWGKIFSVLLSACLLVNTYSVGSTEYWLCEYFLA